jgi:hypothetical protein
LRLKLIIAAAFFGLLFFGAPVYAPPAFATEGETQGCEAYTYKGATAEGNVCAEFPNKPGKDDPYDCGDLKGKTLVLLNPADDPWTLDADKDGWGCEGPNEGPGNPGPNPSESSSSPAPKPSESTSSSAPAPSKSSSSAPGAVETEDNDNEPQLPVTGPSGWVLGTVGVLLAGLGVAAFALTRRRNTKFTA